MAELILPGVSIDVRPEGLIVPRGVTVGNVGAAGTAAKGPIDEPRILGSYAEAVQVFGDYDPWNDGLSDELTLVRALEQAFRHGATTVIAVRVADGNAAAASHSLDGGAPNTEIAVLAAASPGTWGNEIEVQVAEAVSDPFVEGEMVDLGAGELAHDPVLRSARNRIRIRHGGGTLETPLQILYDDDPGPPQPGQVQIDRPTGNLTFGAVPDPADEVIASYAVSRLDGAAQPQARQVTVRYRGQEEVYTVLDGHDLVRDLAASSLVSGAPGADVPGNLPPLTAGGAFVRLQGGRNGAGGASYQAGLDLLLDQNAHIILAAGQDESFGDELAAHCQIASSDDLQRDRIAVVGSAAGATAQDLLGHSLASDRLIFVAPGIRTNDNAATPPVEVTLPGAYAAAAVAGLLAGVSAHVSPTNKTLQVGGLETRFSRAQLKQIVQSRVLALEARQGVRVVRGITTSTNTAWTQITTRRIVDFAKFGVRSAARPYIGLLNNERVRGALRATVNSFLADMVTDEMLVSYELDVSASRADEIRGIARVNMVLRPTFSIDFIQVTMFLE